MPWGQLLHAQIVLHEGSDQSGAGGQAATGEQLETGGVQRADLHVAQPEKRLGHDGRLLYTTLAPQRKAIGSQLLPQVGFAPLGHEPSTVQDQQTIAGVFHLSEDVAGEQHGVLLRQRSNQLAHLPDLLWVQPVDGLVEYQQGRGVHDGHRDANALPVAMAQPADQVLLHLAQTTLLHDFSHALGYRSPLQPAQLRRKTQHGADPHVVIEGRSVGEKTHSAADL